MNMGDMKIKKSGIGAIQDNKIEDMQLAQRVLLLGREALMLGRNGKPKTVEELQARFDAYLEKCLKNFKLVLMPTLKSAATLGFLLLSKV